MKRREFFATLAALVGLSPRQKAIKADAERRYVPQLISIDVSRHCQFMKYPSSPWRVIYRKQGDGK